MTDPQFTALVQALPAIITAVGVLFIGVLAALTRKRDAKADEKADGIAKEVTQIHTVTNSNLSAITAELKQSNAQLLALQERVAAMDKAKDVADTVAKDLAGRAAPAVAEVVVVNTPAQSIPVDTKPKQ